MHPDLACFLSSCTPALSRFSINLHLFRSVQTHLVGHLLASSTSGRAGRKGSPLPWAWQSPASTQRLEVREVLSNTPPSPFQTLRDFTCPSLLPTTRAPLRSTAALARTKLTALRRAISSQVQKLGLRARPWDQRPVRLAASSPPPLPSSSYPSPFPQWR